MMLDAPARPSAIATAVLLALGLAGGARAAEVPGPEPPVPLAPSGEESDEAEGKHRLYWKEGETVFESDDFKIALSNQIQFRFTHATPDDTVQLPGTTAPGDGIGTFRIRRAKTQLEGWFWKEELTYELQIGWAGSDSTGGSATFSGLEDAMLTWDASKDGRFEVRIGQFKVPFGRQELTSSEKQQFVDRSILSGEFTHSRDVGLSLMGALGGGKLDYRVGVFNGNGRNEPINDNGKYQYDARLTLQPWGNVGYSEGDFESRDKPLLALTAEFESNDLHGSTNINDFKDTIVGGDLVFKFKGFSVFGEYFSRERDPEEGPSFHSDGYHVQAGFFLLRDKWEVAFRYASWDPSDASSGDEQTEIGGAVNFYLLKHRFKIQGDYREIEDDVRETKDREIRIQTQFVF